MRDPLFRFVGLAITMALLIVTGASGATHRLAIVREGVADMIGTEVESVVATISMDARYEALGRVANERGLHLAPARAVGKTFSEGYQAVFVPALDREEKEKGFLANSGDVWALSLSLGDGPAKVSEGFLAKLGEDGAVRIEVGFMSTSDEMSRPSILDRVDAKAVSMSCQYVDSTGFNFGCFALPNNPFGQYYLSVYRYGTSPSLSSPAWWACYQGSIHVCPLNEAAGSPYKWITCGAPPAHPQG